LLARGAAFRYSNRYQNVRFENYQPARRGWDAGAVQRYADGGATSDSCGAPGPTTPHSPAATHADAVRHGCGAIGRARQALRKTGTACRPAGDLSKPIRSRRDGPLGRIHRAERQDLENLGVLQRLQLVILVDGPIRAR